MDSGLQMEPGYGYIFSASITIVPSYAYDISNTLALTGWTSAVAQMAAVRYR